jgi:hypothetical protein
MEALGNAGEMAMVRADQQRAGKMTEATDLRNYSSRFAVCLVISILGLLAVPYVGTRWGDFNEMVALIIGLAPLFYILAFSIANLNQRVTALERRKQP